jgi:hypothetical protein
MNIHDIPLIKHTESGNFSYWQTLALLKRRRNGNAELKNG